MAEWFKTGHVNSPWHLASRIDPPPREYWLTGMPDPPDRQIGSYCVRVVTSRATCEIVEADAAPGWLCTFCRRRMDHNARL